jgi:protoheme IX farnesyltransferase
MLPVVAGPGETRRQIMIYSLLLVPASLSPAMLGIAGTLYILAAILFGGVFLFFAWSVYRRRDGKPADTAAGRLFGFSILYLFALFAAILAEHAFGLPMVPALFG